MSYWIKRVVHLTLQFIPIQLRFVMLKSFILSKIKK